MIRKLRAPLTSILLTVMGDGGHFGQRAKFVILTAEIKNLLRLLKTPNIIRPKKKLQELEILKEKGLQFRTDKYYAWRMDEARYCRPEPQDSELLLVE